MKSYEIIVFRTSLRAVLLRRQKDMDTPALPDNASLAGLMQQLLSEVRENRDDTRRIAAELSAATNFTDRSFFAVKARIENRNRGDPVIRALRPRSLGHTEVCLHTSVSQKTAFICTMGDQVCKVSDLAALPTLKCVNGLPEGTVPSETVVMLCATDRFKVLDRQSPTLSPIFTPVDQDVQIGTSSQWTLSSHVELFVCETVSGENLIAGMAVYPALNGETESIMDSCHVSQITRWAQRSNVDEMSLYEGIQAKLFSADEIAFAAPKFPFKPFVQPSCVIPPNAPFAHGRVLHYKRCAVTLVEHFTVIGTVTEDATQTTYTTFTHDRFRVPQWRESEDLEDAEAANRKFTCARTPLALESLLAVPPPSLGRMEPPHGAPFFKVQLIYVRQCQQRITYAFLSKERIVFATFELKSKKWEEKICKHCYDLVKENVKSRELRFPLAGINENGNEEVEEGGGGGAAPEAAVDGLVEAAKKPVAEVPVEAPRVPEAAAPVTSGQGKKTGGKAKRVAVTLVLHPPEGSTAPPPSKKANVADGTAQ